MIIKELAKEFEGEFNCLGENIEICQTFSVPITKEFVKNVINKNGGETSKISYRLQFIDHAKYMASSSQILLIILLKEFMKLNVNMDMKKKSETFVIKCKDRECCFEYKT